MCRLAPVPAPPPRGRAGCSLSSGPRQSHPGLPHEPLRSHGPAGLHESGHPLHPAPSVWTWDRRSQQQGRQHPRAGRSPDSWGRSLPGLLLCAHLLELVAPMALGDTWVCRGVAGLAVPSVVGPSGAMRWRLQGRTRGPGRRSLGPGWVCRVRVPECSCGPAGSSVCDVSSRMCDLWVCRGCGRVASPGPVSGTWGEGAEPPGRPAGPPRSLWDGLASAHPPGGAGAPAPSAFGRLRWKVERSRLSG